MAPGKGQGLIPQLFLIAIVFAFWELTIPMTQTDLLK